MQATDPVFYGGTVNGVLTLNGRIACSPVTGRKIDIYSDGSTIYGFGLNDLEYCVFGGEGSAFTYRIAKPGAVDLAGEIALFVNAAGVGVPVGRPISWGSNTLLVDASGALLVNGAAISGGGASGTAAITGGTINGATIGATTPAAGAFTTLSATGRATMAEGVFTAGNGAKLRLFDDGTNVLGFGIDTAVLVAFAPAADALVYRSGGFAGTETFRASATGVRATALALTGSLAAKSVFAAPNAAAGAPLWRQLLYNDLSGTIEGVTVGATTAATGRFTTLVHTGFLLRSLADNLTASTTNTQAGALGLTASVNIITTAAANSAVRLPNAAPAAGTAAEIILRNNGANPVNVYPQTNTSINSLANNALIAIAAGTSLRFLQTSATKYYTA